MTPVVVLEAIFLECWLQALAASRRLGLSRLHAVSIALDIFVALSVTRHTTGAYWGKTWAGSDVCLVDADGTDVLRSTVSLAALGWARARWLA